MAIWVSCAALIERTPNSSPHFDGRDIVYGFDELDELVALYLYDAACKPGDSLPPAMRASIE